MHNALSEIPAETTREIVDIAGDSAVSRRLTALGFRPGASVRVVGKTPFGDPIVVALDHGRVALRRAEAALVLVHASEPAGSR